MFVSSEPFVGMVFHTRSITSSRTYKNPDPFVDCNHLCGLEEYISQPSSCRFGDIMPTTCAPSTADKIPFDLASAHSSLAGSTTPVAVMMWLKKSTRVLGVIASLNRFSTAVALGTGFGKVIFFATMP